MGGTRHIVTVVLACAVAGCMPPASQGPVYAPQQPPQQQPPPPQQQQPDPSQPQQPDPQPAPPPAPYPAPGTYAQTYPPPAPLPPPPPGRSHLHDGEVIGDFAAVGALAATDILVRQDISDGNVVTFVLLAGIAGGGGAGYLLTQKYDIDAGVSHATTLGLLVGVTNGLLLIEPTGYDHGSSILGLVLAGSALGAAGGFAYGEAARLTPGQATFVGNMTLLGFATAGLGAITGSTNSRFGDWQDGTLALGLDGGVVAGIAIAPNLDWSAHRANVVLASTFIGAMAGSMVAGLLAKPDTGTNTTNNDVIAASMTAGLWGGFGLGIMMTKDAPPDPKFGAARTSTMTSSTTFAPWIGHEGQLGMMAGGFF
ncbi:MAG: hypothetical protein ACM31C_28830 [Acidobacteriota bacterium]